MKKFIYTCLLIAVSVISFSSCTEEEVKPQTTQNTTGGSPEKDGW